MATSVKEAILQTQMAEVVKRLDKIDTRLEEQGKNYITRSEFDAFKKAVRVNYVLVAIVTAIITALVYNFFRVKVG